MPRVVRLGMVKREIFTSYLNVMTLEVTVKYCNTRMLRGLKCLLSGPLRKGPQRTLARPPIIFFCVVFVLFFCCISKLHVADVAPACGGVHIIT